MWELRRPRPATNDGCSANEHTVSNGKKTIMPADVFAALEDTEFGFFRERLEAEYASKCSKWRCQTPFCKILMPY